MGEIFDKYKIDLETQDVFKKVTVTESDDGYHKCYAKDKFNNKYHWRHEIILAEALNLPKHLWPTDEFGRRYVVDHIIPVSKGGTDAVDNLQLISLADNSRKGNGEKTRKRKLPNKIEAYNSSGELVKIYKYREDIENDGFNYNTVRKSILRNSKTNGGVYFKRA